MTNQDQETPQEVERALLGALLLAPEKIPEIRKLVAPGDFALEKHRAIYETLASMPGKVDLPTLTDQLKRAGKGEAAAYLTELVADETYTTANVAEYARRIKENTWARQTQAILLENLSKLREAPGNFRDVHIKLRSEVEELIQAVVREGAAVPSMLDVFAQVEAGIWESSSKPIPTFSWGINRNLNGGLQRGKVFTITGKAGGGKTTLALQILEGIAQANAKRPQGDPLNVCLYIHLEQGRTELLVKSYSRLAQLNGGKIEARLIPPDDSRIQAARKIYTDQIAPYLYVVEGGGEMKLRDVGTVIRKLNGQIQEPHQLIVCVDPFQRLLTGNRDRDKEETSRVGAVASGLKILARDLQVAVILISDTTKAAAREIYDDDVPTDGTQARGSYMIEHTTDVSAVIVCPCNRNEGLFEKLREKWDGDYLLQHEEEAPVYAALDFSKQRSGSTMSVPFLYKKALHEFLQMDEPRKR